MTTERYKIPLISLTNTSCFYPLNPQTFPSNPKLMSLARPTICRETSAATTFPPLFFP